MSTPPIFSAVPVPRSGAVGFLGRLPDGCSAHRNGLSLREGLSTDEWLAIGRSVKEVNAAALWMLGDWLAYGDRHHGGRVAAGIYKQVAEETGYSEQTLTNAKAVCAKIPLAMRTQSLRFGHALEIAFGTAPEEFGQWVDRIEKERLSTKALREQIRASKVAFGREPNDSGDSSFLETASQFARDYQAACRTFKPAYRKEVAKILAPVLRDLAG